MKNVKILILTLALILSSVIITSASSFELTLKQNNYTNEHLESGNGLTLKVINKKGYYAFLEDNSTSYKYGSQQLANINIVSAGIGIKKKIINDVNIFLQFGWYQPQASGLDKGSSFEAMEYLANDRLKMNRNDFNEYYNPYNWPNRNFSVAGNVGGEIGIDITHNFTDNLSLGLSASYRILELWHETKFWDEEYMERTGAYWIFEEYVDYSGMSIGLSLNIKF